MAITSYELVPVVVSGLKPDSPSPTGNLIVVVSGSGGAQENPPRPYGQLFPTYPPAPP